MSWNEAKALRGLTVLLISFLSLGSIAETIKTRQVEGDLRRIVGRPLDAEELKIASYVLVYRYLRCGFSLDDISLARALGRMSDEDYGAAIRQAASLSTSRSAKALLKLGMKGEKIIQTLLMTSRDAVRGMDSYIERRSADYVKERGIW